MMKRVLLLVLALSLFPAASAQAQGPNRRPRTDVTATAHGGPDAEGFVEYRLEVDAVDPDGRINEIIIDFGDGVQLQLLLLCDPETMPAGTPAEQDITWSYTPGHYTVRAIAFSTPDCFNEPLQRSAPAVAPVHVR